MKHLARMQVIPFADVRRSASALGVSRMGHNIVVNGALTEAGIVGVPHDCRKAG